MRPHLIPTLFSAFLLLGLQLTPAQAAPDAKPATSAVPVESASQPTAGGNKQAPKVKAGGTGGGGGSARSAEAIAIKPKLPKCPDPSKCQAEAVTPGQ